MPGGTVNRLNITDDEGNFVAWFDYDKATRYDEDTWWDGSNNVSLATGDKFTHEILMRTAKGRWVLNWWSQWEGSKETYHYITDDAAKAWLLKSNHHGAVDDLFGEVAEEEPVTAGRPSIGSRVIVTLPDDLIAELDAEAAGAGVSRAEVVRRRLAGTSSAA